MVYAKGGWWWGVRTTGKWVGAGAGAIVWLRGLSVTDEARLRHAVQNGAKSATRYLRESNMPQTWAKIISVVWSSPSLASIFSLSASDEDW